MKIEIDSDQSNTSPRMSDIMMQRHKYLIRIITDWMLFRLQLLKPNSVNYFRATKIIHCESRVVAILRGTVSKQLLVALGVG